ncbi:MAG TPA: glycosyltransferase family 39 protein [Candidatus Avacidaminococcus intestinavium]|uniref:Glycosyltransferase family 39 protein n=1 Tax=Candidatus Avacidaminococcus intestinavium TaxID=2840684 RepID=A0A9D1SLZ4_9FIRM|nr:glycosyltransferase family 39 protein [Candidatus Avacidaminococcus intestinavium]
MSKRIQAFLLFILIAFNLFYALAEVPLFDPDEPVYAETAKEMIKFGDYLSPRIYNEFWFDKPPLYYWLVAGVYNVFGLSDAGARIPSALLGLGTVIMLYYSVRKLFDEDVAFWSALVLGTSLEFFYLGKAAVTDMTLLFFLTGALLAFLQDKYLVMYLLMGFATLTKGPIGLVLPGAVIFLYLLFVGDFKKIRHMQVPLGIAIYLLVAAPWYYLMYATHGQVFIDTFLGFHNVTRFTTPEHPNRVLWYYYLPVVIIGLFPWTGLLFDSLKKSITSSSGLAFKNMIFMHIWWIFVLLFFSISQTKLVSYIFPLFPPLAIIIGWNIVRISRERFLRLKYLNGMLCFAFLLSFAIACYVGSDLLPELAVSGKVFAGIVTIIACGILLAFTYYKDILLAAWLQALAGILTMIVAFSFLLPPISDRFSVKSVANYYLENVDQREDVYVDKFLRPGFMYYTELPGEELRPDTQDFSALFKVQRTRYVVVRGLEYRRLRDVDNSRMQTIYLKDDIYLLKID